MKTFKTLISDAWDFLGIGAYFYGVTTVIAGWLGNVEINTVLSNLSLLVGICWITLNVIDKLRNWKANGPKTKNNRNPSAGGSE